MNKITFDRVVKKKPEKFHFVTLEEKEPDPIPSTGMLPLILAKLSI